MQGELVQAESHQAKAEQSGSKTASRAATRVQLKQASFDEGSALLTPVQAKGGITIGAHKGKGEGAKPAGKGEGAKPGGKGPSGITIGAHKTPAAPPQSGAQQGVANAPPGQGGSAAHGGIVIGAHKAPGQAPGQAAGQAPGQAAGQAPGQTAGQAAPGQAPGQAPGHHGGIVIGAHKAPPPGAGPAGGPPQKPLPAPPQKPGGPPQKPLPAPPQKPGGPPQKPVPAPPGGADAQAVGQAAVPGAPTPADPMMAAQGGLMQAAAGIDPKAVADTGAASEQSLEDEDRASFANVDGNLYLFDNESLVSRYFNAFIPGKWASVHPVDHGAIRWRCMNQLAMSDRELFALIGYTGPGYAPMNRLTRGQMKSKRFTGIFKPYTDAASSALEKLDNGQEKHTQRGWRSIPDGDPKRIEDIYGGGREYVDEKGFMSTTANSEEGFFAGPVSIQIKGTSGVDIQQLSVLPSEGEVLYKPNTRFKVARFQRNVGVEAGWRAWHQDNDANPKPTKPWFEVDLEER